MSDYQFVALLLAAIGPVLALARLAHVPPTIALFGLGLASAYLPGLPRLAVDPQLVLTLFLPLLLYASTVRVSWQLLRFTLLPGVVLGALLVLTTIVSVAWTTHALLLPGLSWTGAFFLGAVAAIFDTRLFHEAKGRPHVPRAIADTLKARELVGRLFILATFGLALEVVQTERFSLLAVGEHFALDIPAGLLLGVAVGQLVVWARRRIDPAPVEIAVSIATPYAAALAASALGVSIIGAVTAAALVISAVRIDPKTGASISSSETRISATAFWEEVSLLVSSALFFLAGRSLPEALAGLDDWPVWLLASCSLALLALVLGIQVGFAYLATGLSPLAGVLGGEHGRGRPRAAAAGVMAWSSTRSVIGLVIALAVPRTFPERDLILVLAAVTIVGSILVQGLTLRAVVARAGLRAEGEREGEVELGRRAMEKAVAAPGTDCADGFDAARVALLQLRSRDQIGDEVLIELLRETDLTARASEGDALPGAGPPNP